MKTIFRIAKTELRILFYSPIAWFLLVIFFVQCSLVYVNQLDSAIRNIAMSYSTDTPPRALTMSIFFGPNGLFSGVLGKLFLFIPLLTMSLISRETGSGTIKLLYSSPIKVRQIIFGKYLAMMLYGLMFLSILLLFIVLGTFHIQYAETGMLLVAALAFYLILCTFSAIGLFMSCLTTHQLIAAISTFIMIGCLSYIGEVWQNVAFIRDITNYLYINVRAYNMLSGLLTSQDIVYFLIIIYIFLGLSIYKLKADMESKSFVIKTARYLGIIISALFIGYVSSTPRLKGYLDVTSDKSRTLLPVTQKIIRELEGSPLEITIYNNLLSHYYYLGNPQSYYQNLRKWEPYMRFKEDIKINQVDFYDVPLDEPVFAGKSRTEIQKMAEDRARTQEVDLADFKTPEEISRIIDLKPEGNRYVMQLKWKGRTTWLRVFFGQNPWPGEAEVSAALKRLLQAKLPKVAFLTGDMERSITNLNDREYNSLTKRNSSRNALINQGFDVDTLSLEREDIPQDISTLVIADPMNELTPAAIDKIQKYIAKGGNLLITCEPENRGIVNPLLQQLGVQLMEGTLLQQSSKLAPNNIAQQITPLAASFSKLLNLARADSNIITMPGATALSYSNNGPFMVRPLLLTDKKLSWLTRKKVNLEQVITADAGKDAGSGEEAAVVKKKMRATTKMDQEQKVATGTERKAEILKRLKLAREKMNQEQITTTNVENKDSDSGKVVAVLKKNMPTKTKMDQEQKVPTGTEKKAEILKRMKLAKGKMNKEQIPATNVYNNPPVDVNAKIQNKMLMAKRNKASIGNVKFSPEDGDIKGPFPTALVLTRTINNKEQRIIVTGDADFMSTGGMNHPGGRVTAANFVFNTAIFSWLSYGEFPIDASRPGPKDISVTVDTGAVKVMRLLLIWILPGLLLLFASVLLIRRKRK